MVKVLQLLFTGDSNGVGTVARQMNDNDSLDIRFIDSNNLDNDPSYLDILNDCEINSLYYSEESFVNSFSNSSKIIVLSCNIQSLHAKFTELNILLDNLRLKKACPDIILVQESWIKDPASFNIKGFSLILNARPPDLRGGGTMIYYSDRFNVTTINIDSFFIPKIFECSLLQLSIPGKIKLVVSSVYHPPSLINEENVQFFSNLELFLEFVNELHLPTVVGGDFNYNLFNLDDINSNASELITLFAYYGFINTINKATRIYNNSYSALDQIFVNDFSILNRSAILIDTISDHFFTLAEINIEKPKLISDPYKFSRDFSIENIERFKQALSNQSWFLVLNSTDTNESCDFFLNTFFELYEIFFQIRRVKVNKNYHPICPFMTKGLLISRRQNLKLANKARRFPSLINKDTYKSYRLIYNKMVRLSKKLHYNKKISDAGSDSRKIWSVLKEVVNVPSKDNSIGPLMGDDALINNDVAKANYFNNYFSHIGEVTSIFIPSTNTNFEDFLPPPCLNSMFMNPIQEETFKNFVLGIKPKLSKDINGISMRFLHSVINEIKKPLTHIFNLSVEHGVFPENFKVSKSIPIFKSGDKTLVNNYRLVSLINNFSKPFEKIICNRLLEFLEQNKFFTSSQFGFRQKLSTKLAVLTIINYVTKNINDNKIVLALFLDIMKAFDSVNHEILFKKLENAGVRGVALCWFKSYLFNRKQRVFVNGSLSDNLCAITLGILQGSILGVILFLVMINDIGNCCPELFNIIFADDDSALVESTSLEGLIEKANDGLNKLVQWYSSNKLAIHPAKSKGMIFQASNKFNIPTFNNSPYLPIFLNLNNVGEIDITKITPIKIVPNAEEKTIKVLGIYLDDKLNFKQHINVVHAKISKAMYSLNQMKHILDGFHLKLLFSAYLKSHLDYADIFYCLCNKTTLKPLELVYKKAIRILSGAGYRDHTKPLFIHHNILPIKENSDFNILKVMFRRDHSSLPKCLNDFWRRNIDVSGRGGRNADNFYQESINFNYLEKHPFFYFPKLFNELPNNIKCLESEKEFNKQAKAWLMDNLD